MDGELYPRALLALLLVLGLILLCSWALRRYGSTGRFATRGQKRLGIVEVAALDARRRLVLVRRDDVEHLLLLGPTHDIVVESHIAGPSAAPAALPPTPSFTRSSEGWLALRGALRCLGLALLCLTLLCLALPAAAQSISLDLGGEGGSTTGRIIQLVALMTVLSLAPGILVTVTSFTRIIIVLSFLRTAMGIQATPPNTVLVSLALFLTAFIMAPTLERSYNDGIKPLIEERISEVDALAKTAAPFHDFMMAHVREQDLALFMNLGKMPPAATPADTPYRALPARLSHQRAAPRLRDRLPALSAVPGDRHRGRVAGDVDGHGEPAAQHPVAAVQADLLRADRRLVHGVRLADPELRAAIGRLRHPSRRQILDAPASAATIHLDEAPALRRRGHDDIAVADIDEKAAAMAAPQRIDAAQAGHRLAEGNDFGAGRLHGRSRYFGHCPEHFAPRTAGP